MSTHLIRRWTLSVLVADILMPWCCMEPRSRDVPRHNYGASKQVTKGSVWGLVDHLLRDLGPLTCSVLGETLKQKRDDIWQMVLLPGYYHGVIQDISYI